ncbi:SDR family oxidoreductase [Methylocystis heyeri]|uniref:SDR family NAD(P)-dependent oxidoreductase n=1 Tax=Methylocystis heyeri TaxID=391905 RepID=A0A6B8KJ16_9HYPH|nr:SDR family oxidoreductase [Methylocystis heyeri]QGM46538.1 SDR family NAD(P)-dependent oxidoreductase [Methylocystis heyeri]
MGPFARNQINATVVITGGSAGLGRALAHRFAEAGARVGIIARDAQALASLKDEFASSGVTVHIEDCDVADAAAVFMAADEMERALGPINIWINCAMLTVFSPFERITPEEFRRVTEATYLGYVHGTMAALRRMKPRNSGTILQIGSALAYRAIPLQSAYCGAKHAIRGFTNSLRCELLRDRSSIKLTMVQLPAMNTPQFDWARTHMGREPRPVAPVYQPEAIAEAVFRAAQEGRREYWLGRATIAAILGDMAAPAFLDRFLARHAYVAQERAVAVGPTRCDNLFAPITELHRIHGSFDAEAAARVFMWPELRIRAAAAGAAIILVLVILWLLAEL